MSPWSIAWLASGIVFAVLGVACGLVAVGMALARMRERRGRVREARSRSARLGAAWTAHQEARGLGGKR